MSKREEIVQLAKDLQSKVQYVFGANDTGNFLFDCSSFTQYVYKCKGILIGRDTISQSSGGKVIEKKDLKLGDLVFFQGTYRSGVSHVGIYIGNGKFIHNSSTKNDVVISNLNDPFWKEHWYGARTYIEDGEVLDGYEHTWDKATGNGYNEMTGEWVVQDGTEPKEDKSYIEKVIDEYMSKYSKSFGVGVLMVLLVVLALLFVYKAVGDGVKATVTDKIVDTISGGE